MELITTNDWSIYAEEPSVCVLQRQSIDDSPLAYADDTFDLVYALSVFTHLTEDLCEAWMDELYRIVKPGGAAIVTTHGGATTHLLSQDESPRTTRTAPSSCRLRSGLERTSA